MESTSDPRASALLPASGGDRFDQALRVLCLLSAVAVAIPGVVLSARVWERSPFYSHGYVIPAVFAYLLYTRRDLILDALRDASPARWGALAVLGAGVIQVIAVVGDIIFLSGVGVVLLLGSTCYALGGRRLLHAAGGPIAYLLFLAPPPGFVLDRVLVQLKILVTGFAITLLQNAGYTVAAVGNKLLLPGKSLFVADACSGLTSIVTLVPLGVIVAYFMSHGVWRRAAIVASVVPLAIAANIVRVTMTVVLVDTQGVEFAQGLLHESFGVSTYIVGTLVMLAFAKVLR